MMKGAGIPSFRMTLLFAAALTAACSPGRERPADSVARSAITDSAGGETVDSMAGMDHSKMPGMSDTSRAAPMAGMDHSNMPGMGAVAATKPTGGVKAGAGSMAGMDHSSMPGMGATPTSKSPGNARAGAGSMAGMDHSNMPGMSRPPASGSRAQPATPSMAGMDHSRMTMPPTTPGQKPAENMAGMDHSAMALEFGANEADAKLSRIIVLLAQDTVVLRRIQTDANLRRAWQDTAVRRLILNTPGGQ